MIDQFPVGLKAQLLVTYVEFGRKNYHAKNGEGKRGPGGRDRGREQREEKACRRQTPEFWKLLTWPFMSEFHTVIGCHKLTIRSSPFPSGSEL